MVFRGKPDPESFLLAAKGLEAAPEHCLVIEDGRSGMEAAKAAGMRCGGLVEDVAASYPTPLLLSNLEDVTVAYIRSL